MKRIIFLTPDDLPYGFAIAGLEQLMIAADEAHRTLLETTDDPDVGVVVIDERLLVGVEDEVIQKLHHQWPGQLLVLPTPAGAVPVEEDYLQRLIRRALGYHVRIRE